MGLGLTPATRRNVRQDTPLWRELHEGVLTTSRMKYALGFAEPRAARLLRGKHMVCAGTPDNGAGGACKAGAAWPEPVLGCAPQSHRSHPPAATPAD